MSQVRPLPRAFFEAARRHYFASRLKKRDVLLVMTTLNLVQGAVNGIIDVWYRNDGKEVHNKPKELFEQICIVTGMNFISSDWVIKIKFDGDIGETYQCACSKLELSRPFIVEHIPTSAKILIGSSCIHRFGNEELDAKVRAYNRGNKCIGGNAILDMRTHDGKAGLCDEINCRCHRPKCPKCHQIIENDGACGCEICDWCEKYPFKCTCQKCYLCGKVKQACKCKKCQNCKDSIEGGWRTLCSWCWREQELVSCLKCDKMVPKHPYKKLCVSCFTKRT